MHPPASTAYLEMYVGPMFSAKTERLIAELKRATYAKKRILVLKPACDTRTDAFIASRHIAADGTVFITDTFDATVIETRGDFLNVVEKNEFDVLAIDEAQFFPLDGAGDSLGWFGREIRSLLQERRSTPLRILIAGLDTDFSEEPFGPIPGLLALADRVEKLYAVCMVCGSFNAHLSQRLVKDSAQLVVGDKELYQARCRACYEPPRAD